MKPEIHTYPGLPELSRAAAEDICHRAEEAIKERDTFTLVLSGGSTPRLLHEELARQPISKRIEWQKTHIFWGDERLVEPVHPDSNYGVAFRALVSKVDVPPANIHRVITESRSASAAAEEYEQTLRHFFCPPAESEDHAYFPSFDVILLGLGQDGHTASLFPGDPALEEKYRWVVAVSGARGSPPIPRITLTFPVINKARCAIFLASGREKREVFQKIISNHETVAYPAARVRPSGKLLWFVDELMV